MDDNRTALKIEWNCIPSTIDLIKFLKDNNVPTNKYGIFVKDYQNFKAKEKGIPLNGLFELTPFCNLDCRMCYVHLERNALWEKKVISTEKWIDLIHQAYDAGMRYAGLSGGECLIYPGFKDIYLYLYNLGIRPTIKTNAILLTESWIKFFRQYPPVVFEISLYGCSEEGYERVTGHRVFNLVLNNLKNLKKASLPVNIAITPSKYLNQEIDGIIQIAKQLQFSYFINYCIFTPRKETERENCDLNNEQYIALLKRVSQKFGDINSSQEQMTDLPDFGDSDVPQFGVNCGAGRNSFNITWNGMLFGCFNLELLKSSVVNQSFAKAWYEVNSKAQQLQIPMECANCAYVNICETCVACHCINGDASHCNPKICERTKEMVKEGIIKLS